MATLTLQLPPGRTAQIQLYARIGGAAVGSPITMIEGAASIYTCTVPSGDYDVQLSGISTPNGVRFPMRDGIAYPDIPWSLIEIVSGGGTPTNPGPPGLCTVRFSVRDASGPIANAVVEASLNAINATIENSLIALTVTYGVTNPNGIADLVLIRQDSFTNTGGGIYHFVVTQPCGKVVFDKRAFVMNASTGTADDLVAV